MGYSDANIKILMMGASRVGKTSILAAMSESDALRGVTKGTNIELIPTACEEVKNAAATMKNYFDFTLPIPGTADKKHALSEMVLCDGGSSRSYDYSIGLGTKGGNSKYNYSLDLPIFPVSISTTIPTVSLTILLLLSLKIWFHRPTLFLLRLTPFF